ncbi:MAG: hypothetical protein ACYC0V_19675 [Armatimonadota bacterium]
MKWYEKIQHIDTRIMYLILAVVIAIPLIWNLNLPIIVSPAVQGAYDAVEKIPDNKIAIISANWAAGTIAENKPQTEAIMRHMFMKGKKFAILSFDVQGSQFARDISDGLAKEYSKTYGVDYVHWGYRPFSNIVLLIQGMARNVPKAIGKDINGTPITEIPMMKNIKDIKDIGLITEITPSGTLEVWIAYVYGIYRTPIIYAPTAVMAPEGFNPLDAGQIKGMLTGMKGAAEYEKLIGKPGFATKGTGALSASHLLIIILIIIGNTGYIISRIQNKKETTG